MYGQYIRSIRLDWEKVAKESYLSQIPALQGIRDLTLDTGITFFVGNNGTGKSTLLEAIAIVYGFNPEGGTLNYRFSTYPEHSELAQAISLIKGTKRPHSSYFFRAESFFNVATKAIEYGSSFGGRSLHEQSYGESFLSFFQAFDGKGLFLMDEPEAALSPQRQLTLLIEMKKMVEQGSQFIITTHSPILLGFPQAKILTFDKGPIQECSYTETESYQVTKMFITNREIMLRRLFEE